MKTAMKRLLSFVLVAMMLVSVVPFQASADEQGTETETVSVRYCLDEGVDNEFEKDLTTTGAKVGQTLNKSFVVEKKLKIDESKYDSCTVYYCEATEDGWGEWQVMPDSITLAKDTWVVINAVPKATESQPTEPQPTESQPTEPQPTESQPEDDEFTITFLYCDKENCRDCDEKGDCASVTRTTKNQRLRRVDLPSIPLRYGYTFSYWKNITNRSDEQPQDMRYTSDVTFMAIYKEDADSNLHKVKVYGVTYNDGKTNVLSNSLVTMYVEDEADLLTALRSKASAIQDELDARGYSQENKYTWDGYTFYDDSDLGSDDKVASGTEVTGDGNYYIKVKYTGNNKVQLYIHTSKTLTIKDTVTLTTYAPGETISQSQIASAVKNAGWSYGTLRTYTRDAWEKIVDRDSSSAADETKSFTVSKGETEIHVYLTGASGSSSSSSSSSNKSDNPKTGDTILMAVTVMGLSASALAAVYFVSKKKQSL